MSIAPVPPIALYEQRKLPSEHCVLHVHLPFSIPVQFVVVELNQFTPVLCFMACPNIVHTACPQVCSTIQYIIQYIRPR